MTKAKVKLVLNLGCDARNNGVYRYAKLKKKGQKKMSPDNQCWKTGKHR